MNKERGMVMMVQECGPRRNVSSVGQSRGQNVWFAIKSNVPSNSTVKDKYQEGTRQKEVTKYLRENCYNHI